MKKFPKFFPLGIALFIFLLTGVNNSQSAVELVKGDVSGDEYIDGRDALLILQHLEKILTLSQEQWERGDVYPNPGTEGRRVGDGALTRNDALTILEETVGLISPGDLTGDYNQSQPIIDALEPSAGRVGDRATLMGRNFPAGNSVDTELFMGEVRAEIVSITGSLITFVVPEGAASARIRLNTLGGSAISDESFSVLDAVAGVLKVDGTLDPQNFVVISAYDFAEIDNAQGAFVLYASKDEMQIYQATMFNDENPNLYQYYYIPGYSPSDTPIQIDALSTAKAMVFTNPFVASKDTTIAAQTFDLMNELPEITQLAKIIAERFPLGVDGVNDPEIGATWIAAIEALLDRMGELPAAKTNTPSAKRRNRNDVASSPLAAAPMTDYPADAGDTNPEVRIYGIDRNYLSAKYQEATHSIKMGLDNGYSPVDWLTALYKLNPNDYPRGLNTPFFDIQTSGFKQSLYQTSCLVPANLWTAKINVRLEVVNMLKLGNLVDSLTGTTSTNLPLQGTEDGLYLIHGYSGALYTPNEQEKKDFDAIWNIVDGFEMMNGAYISNLTQILVDIWDFQAKKTKLDKGHIKTMVKNISKRLAQDLTDKEFLQHATDEVIVNLIWDCLVEAIKARITSYPVKWISCFHGQISNAANEMLEQAQDKIDEGVLRSIVDSNKLLKLLGTISAGGRVIERFMGLMGRLINVYELELSPGPSPLESAIVVVGDPFSPQIASVSSLQGPPESEVVIEGSRFYPEREGNTVWFGNTQAEVLSVVGREKLIVKVPQPNTNFAYFKSYTIKVETPGMMKAAEASQPFTLLRIPIITSLSPNRIFPSVPGDDPGPFAGQSSTFAIVGAGLNPGKYEPDQIFIGDTQVTDLSYSVKGDQIVVTLPTDIHPGKYEVYIVSPGYDNYTTSRFPLEVVGAPEVYSVDPIHARVGQNITVKGTNFSVDLVSGVTFTPRIKVGDQVTYDVSHISNTEFTFRMPTVGEVGDVLEVTIYTPAGSSGLQAITRDAGLDDTQTSLPAGFWISVNSPVGGPNPDGQISIDEAASIARGEINPFEKPWDDENEEWTHYYYQVKRVNDNGNPYYIWEENEEQIVKNYFPGGQGDEKRKHYRIDQYHPDNGGAIKEPYLDKTEILDQENKNKEEGDWVTGSSGGEDYADKIIVSSANSQYSAVNFILGNHDSVEFQDNLCTLTLGERGIQIPDGCFVYLPIVRCELGDAVTITGSHNYITGTIQKSGQNGIVVNEGIANTICVSVEQCNANGMVIKGGGANQIAKLISKTTQEICAAQNGIIIENSIQNEISRMCIQNCGGHGIYLKNADQTEFLELHIYGNQGDSIVFENSAYNSVRYVACAGNRSGLVLSGPSTIENRIEHVAIGATYNKLDGGFHESRFMSFQRMQSHGIHLCNQANTNIILDARIYETGDDGLLLEDSGTKDNIINACTLGDVGNTDHIPNTALWPPKSAGNGIVIRKGASQNSFYDDRIYRQMGHSVVVQDTGSDKNTFSTIRMGDSNGYGNDGWGAVVSEGPLQVTFDIAYTRFNQLGGFLIDRNCIAQSLGISNIVMRFCEVEGSAGGAGFELFSSSNVFLDRCKTKGYDYGLWIHGPNSQSNDIWSGLFRNGAQAGILVEGSTGDRIDNSAYQDCTNVVFYIKDSDKVLLNQLRYQTGGTKTTGVIIRIENSQSIQVCECNFSSETLGNGVEILNSSDILLQEGGCQETGDNGIWIGQQSHDIVLDQFHIANCSNNGILATGVKNLTIQGGESFFNQSAGLRIENSKNVVIQDYSLLNNLGDGIHILGEQTENVTVASSVIAENNLDGIHAEAGTGLTIGLVNLQAGTMNYIEMNKNAGIYLSGANTKATVVNNAIGVGRFTFFLDYGNEHGIILSDGIRETTIQNNQIMNNHSQGIWLQNGANDNVISENQIWNNLENGVLIQGAGTVRNALSMNSISGNFGKGIALEDGGNAMQEAPVIEKVTWQGENIRGSVSAPNGSVVEIYADLKDEGRYMAGMGKVLYNRFHADGSYDPSLELHGIVITPDGNTSEFGFADITPERNERFVFTGEQDGNRDIYYRYKRDESPVRLTTNAAADYSPYAFNGGSGIVFVSERQGNPDIWLYRTTQRDEIALTSNSAPEYDPCIESGETSLLFVSEETGKANIFRASLLDTQTLGTDLQRLTNNNGDNRHPAVSNGGSEIAFSSNQGGTWDIWVMNADGSGPRKVTDGVGSNTYPAWTPGGQSIVFVSDRNGQPDLYQINKDGSGLLRLTQNAGIDSDPSWSLDCKRILFSSDRDAGLEIYGMANGETQVDRLTFVSGSASEPNAAPLISSLQEAESIANSDDSPVSDTQLDIQLTASPTIAKPGETVAISIDAAQNGKLAALLLEAVYDSTVLHLVSAQTDEEILEGSLVETNPPDISSDHGWLWWNWAHPYGLVGDSNLMVLSFQIDSDVQEKETQIDLSVVQAYDLDLQKIEVNYGSAVVTIDVEITAVKNWMIYE